MALVAQSKDQPSNALERVMGNIRALGLDQNLIDLETQGFTVLKGVLTPTTIARATDAIVRSTERFTGKSGINVESGSDLKGMTYVPHLLYDDPVFEEVLMEEKPLALVTYLLGESCLLSSMGCHFRMPGGLPLMLHSDNGNGTPAPFSNTSYVANVNYALTPYSKEAGCLAMVPGSHKLLRQPTLAENFRPRRASKDTPLDEAEWIDPPNVVPMNIEPGDAVVWHGNTWHGGFRREFPGARINLAAYFCRQFVQTQEQHGRAVPKELLARHANDDRFARLLGQRAPYGWGPEGPDYSLMNSSPRGLYD